MKQKTQKSISKRFKVTTTGKLLRQKGGKNHFNSRESGNTTRNKRRDETMAKVDTRNVKMLMCKY
jgi:large subunit ribosomal protein L35